MKILALVSTTLLSLSVWSQNEMISPDVKKRVMTVAKDVDVEKKIMQSAEVNECFKDAKYDPKTDYGSDKTAIQQKIEACFKQKLSNKKPEELKKLSENLRLQEYGLVKSNKRDELTKYFTDKIQRALTGRDPNQKSQKFDESKIVDQKVYLELSLNNLNKSVTYEVSRFCFENLRRKANTNSNAAPIVLTNFYDHWKGYQNEALKALMSNKNRTADEDATLSNLLEKDFTDSGDAFTDSNFNQVTDLTQKEDVYAVISKSLGSKGTQFDPTKLGDIFAYCAIAIRGLCDNFQKTQSGDGANACLAKNRIEELNKALVQTQATIKEIENDKSGSVALEIPNQKGTYNYGNTGGEKTLDEISTLTSTDILDTVKEDDLADLAQKCSSAQKYSDLSDECQQFLAKGDDTNKALYNAEASLTAKKLTEIALLEQLQKDSDKDKLKKYYSYYEYLLL